MLPWQQPAQEVASQTQAPTLQRRPAAHAGPDPHWQVPEAAQVSALAPQVRQTPPSVPHAPVPWAAQAPALQQPLGQEAPSHRQPPAAQRWPAAQDAAAPHWQVPEAEQVSDLWTSHATQALPRVPQLATEAVRQVAPEQQPLGQLAEVQPEQMPALQVWPPAQL